MALLAELIPIITFFISYRIAGLYLATLTTMLVSVLHMLVNLIQQKPIPLERWINITVLLLLSSMTLFSNNSEFIKCSPTVKYLILATTFSLTPRRLGSTILESSFGHTLRLSKTTWNELNQAWIIFFSSMGLLNLAVAYTSDTDTWVYFKLFGLVILTVLFIVSQVAYLLLSKKIISYHDRV